MSGDEREERGFIQTKCGKGRPTRSANGTVVKEVGGRTTLLKRGERAVLRTGDEICLINHVSARGALGIPLTRCSSC